MSFEEQSARNYMNNPFNPQFNLQKAILLEPDKNQDNSNATTTTLPKAFNHQQNDKLTNNLKKIKPSLNIKPTQIPSCFTNLTTNFSDNDKHSTSKHSNQQESTASKTRPRKILKSIICEGDQLNNNLSVIKEQATNEKTGLIPQSQQKNNLTSQPAQLTATILPKSNLREKFAHLLPPNHQRTLSSEQQHLINVMSMIDQTIEYWMKNRNVKLVFFQDLKRSIRDSLKVFIDFKHLEQLLYLDETLYELKWQKGRDMKKHDILMKLPQIKSKQARKTKLRETIVAFLTTKHDQFLKAKGITKFVDNVNWHDEFSPHHYEIPRLPLPPHPQTKSAQLRCLDDSKINAIKNEKVRELFRSEKQRTDVKSFAKQQSSMQMIFSGTSADVLEQRLIAAVKQREDKAKLKMEIEAKQIEKEKTEVSPDTLKEVAEILLKSYSSKNVSNMFKVKVMQVLKERTNNKFGQFAISRHLEYLLEQKVLGYLKEVTARDGSKILQINIGKYKQVLGHVQQLRKKTRQEVQRV